VTRLPGPSAPAAQVSSIAVLVPGGGRSIIHSDTLGLASRELLVGRVKPCSVTARFGIVVWPALRTLMTKVERRAMRCLAGNRGRSRSTT
jgi:hypothetical protein